MSRGPVMAERLRVDPIACDGVGICTHLAPDLVGVDSWGFPIVWRAARPVHPAPGPLCRRRLPAPRTVRPGDRTDLSVRWTRPAGP